MNNDIIIKVDVQSDLTFWQSIKIRIAGKKYLELMSDLSLNQYFKTILNGESLAKIYTDGKKEAERLRLT